MPFVTEAELQDYCLAVLKSKGIAAESEVWVGKLRADIVTADSVYELKKVLDRTSIYQALGQATAYNRVLKRKYIRIVGQAPISPTELQQAMTIAKEISTSQIEVSFVEHDPFWRSESASLSGWFNLSLDKLNLIIREALWMIGGGILFASVVAIAVNSLAGHRVPRESLPAEQRNQAEHSDQ
ncbi:MAG: hypothetical protein MUC48_05010 [Leptolyngbya sp. Prado105]|jgi:hypothetical protein|nr:hypothetical protein [Leptolyngbya sp. Prado105]